MRILQVFNRYREQGGEEKSVERVFQHGAERFQIDRYIRESEDWAGPEAPGKVAQLRKLFFNTETLVDLQKLKRPEVILTHNLYPVISPSLFTFAKEEGIPVIQYVHNFRPFSVGGSCWANDKICADGLEGKFWPEVKAAAWQGSWLKSACMALMLKRLQISGRLDQVKCWIAISDFMRESFIRAGIPADRVVTLRHSWDAMAEVPKTDDGGYYLLLARLIPEKGIECCLRAWKLMGDMAPPLVIAGTGGLKSLVEEAAEESQKISYRGFVSGDEKHELIANCRSMLAPSVWWEPLGLVTYEAYDFAKPMIAAASGGLTETIVDGETGYLHIPNDPKSLVESVGKIEKLSTNERREMGQAGRRWLLDETDPSKWMESFSAIVNSVIDGCRASC